MRNEIVDEFKKRGYTPAQIAGILGNIAVETGGSFDYQQKQRGAKNPAHGIFQLDPNGGKYQDYQNWLKKNKKQDSVASQVAFFDDTIFGKSVGIPGAGNAAKLRKGLESEDPATIAQIVSDLWLRPQKGKEHNDRRVQAAMNEFKALQTKPAQVAAPEPAKATPEPEQQYSSISDFMNPLMDAGGKAWDFVNSLLRR